MRKSFKVILDCDDVLYQCNGYALEKLNRVYGSKYMLSDITTWGPLGNSLDRRLQLFSDPDFVSEQPLFPGAKKFVDELSKRSEVVIATNVPAQCAGARIAAIVRDFPEIPLSNILIGGRKDLLTGDMMLDDAPQNLDGANVHYPVLFRQPWNYGRTGMLSISTYREFLTLVDMVKESESMNPCPPEAIVLVGPSGAGKKKLAEKLVAAEPKICRVYSYTTKADPNYKVLSKEQFESERESFFETSSYMGHLYGTRFTDVQSVIDAGKIPLLVMDMNGMVAMKSHFHVLSVFVKAKKEDCIRDISVRLLHGMPLDEAVHRIAGIDTELRNEEFCDLTLVNDISPILLLI